MKQSIVLRRFANAAKQLGRQHFDVPMTAEAAVGEPSCWAGRPLPATVELQSGRDQSARVRCLMTLEPNGTLSCFVPMPSSSFKRKEVKSMYANTCCQGDEQCCGGDEQCCASGCCTGK